jgi:hypothetical protein
MAVLRGAVMVALCVLSLAVLGHALPMNPRVGRERERDAPDVRDHPNVDEGQYRRPRMPDTPGLDLEEYNRYWQEMAKDNPVLQEKLKQINPEQLAKLHPRVSEKMARDSEAIRSRLEEARRMNMDEMRELQRLQRTHEQDRRNLSPESEWVARQQAMRERLPPDYDQDDIQKRMDEQRRILEEIERKRRDEFDHYQMQQERQKRENLKAMDEQQRLKAEQSLREQRERQMHHERMNQPASKQQFEEVWEEDDGLKDEEFDPKTFFFLHDTNGDKILDPLELQALFYTEVKKAYGKDMDNMHTQEELARMREYALKQLDRNGDSMISLDEFLSYAQGEKFEENEEWKPVTDEQEAFTEEELRKFEEDYYDDYYDYEYDERGNIIGFKEKPKQDDKQPSPPEQPAHEEEMRGDTGANADATAQPPAPSAAAGTLKEGQAQQFHKNPGDNLEDVPGRH